MITTQKALEDIVNYEKLSVQNALEPPKIKKEEISDFILCSNFDKARQKIDRTMDRYNKKVDNLKEKLQQLEQNIKHLEKQHRKWKSKASTFLLDRSDLRAVEKQNNAAENANRLLDQISATQDKYNDLIETHNEAIQEAEEKRQELTEEALDVIDDDIVAVLDKCTKIAAKLSGSQNSEDQMTALEVSLIEMKIHHFFEDHIEGNTARKDARDRISEVSQHFAELCANDDVRNHISDLFRRNIYLMNKNDSQYGQTIQMVEAVDQSETDQMIQNLQEIFNEKFDTSIDYENVIDPSVLHDLTLKINERIKDIKNNISKASQVDESTKSLAENGVKIHNDLEKLLESAKQGVEELGNDLISHEHFTIELLNESVIDDFYSRDLRPKVVDFRKYLADEIEEEKLDLFIMTEEDRFSLQKIENTIKEANFKRLQLEKDKIEAHKEKMNNLIESLQKIIKNIKEIPKKKSDELKSDYSKKSILSCIPLIGFIFSFGIFRKIKSFETAFKSTNQIYRDIGTTLFAENKKIIIINLIVGFVSTVGSLIALLLMETGFPFSVKLGLPGVILFLYLVSTLFLFLTGKKLDSYIGLTSEIEQKETATENS